MKIQNRMALFLWLSLAACSTSSSLSAAAEPATYREPWRPQFHFTPATNWMNDPNGMLFYEGEYHLFYQFNPFGAKWGHMSWGHAVSRDLVHWEHLPVALVEENDVMIFSGSAVVDWKNSSGFGKDGKPPLVAIYTGHYTKKPLQNQHLAFSNDRGRTWTKYPGNPVLDIGAKDFRDPKVRWHEPTRNWIMTVAWPVERKIRFYGSPDLKQWKHLSDFGPAGSTEGIWECPDLFPLPARNSKEPSPWVLIVNVGSGAPAGGSGCQYFVGNFDGRQFTLHESFPRPVPEFVPDGRVLADFEGEDFGDWRAEGTAFGPGPVRGKLEHQQTVEGFRGRGLLNSFVGGDGSQGTLTSPQFEVTGDYLSFLIGGGKHPGQTCLNLLIDDQVVRSATGDDSERLGWKFWVVKEFRGRTARLQVVDRHSGGWGHVNVDHIVLGDAPASPGVQPALWADYGADFYAAVSWSDVPVKQGRTVWLGWMSNWRYANDVPTAPWRSAMSLPRELTLRDFGEGLRLSQQPVRELKKLRGRRHRLGRSTLEEAGQWLGERAFRTGLLEGRIELESDDANATFILKFESGEGEETLVSRTDDGKVRLDRRRAGNVRFHPGFAQVHLAPWPWRKQTASLHFFLDSSSLEVFLNDGEVVLTDLILPSSKIPKLTLSKEPATRSQPRIRSLEVWELQSAWR